LLQNRARARSISTVALSLTAPLRFYRMSLTLPKSISTLGFRLAWASFDCFLEYLARSLLNLLTNKQHLVASPKWLLDASRSSNPIPLPCEWHRARSGVSLDLALCHQLFLQHQICAPEECYPAEPLRAGRCERLNDSSVGPNSHGIFIMARIDFPRSLSSQHEGEKSCPRLKNST
jgi:hypothetical protein